MSEVPSSRDVTICAFEIREHDCTDEVAAIAQALQHAQMQQPRTELLLWVAFAMSGRWADSTFIAAVNRVLSLVRQHRDDPTLHEPLGQLYAHVCALQALDLTGEDLGEFITPLWRCCHWPDARRDLLVIDRMEAIHRRTWEFDRIISLGKNDAPGEMGADLAGSALGGCSARFAGRGQIATRLPVPPEPCRGQR